MATSVEFPSTHSVNQVLYSLHLVLFGLSVNDVEWVVNIQMILNTTRVQDNKNKPCTWFLSPGCSSGRHKSSTPSPTSSPPPLTLATRRGRRRRWRGIGTGREGRGRGWGGSDGIPVESKVPSRSRGQGSTMIWEQFGLRDGWSNPPGQALASLPGSLQSAAVEEVAGSKILYLEYDVIFFQQMVFGL